MRQGFITTLFAACLMACLAMPAEEGKSLESLAIEAGNLRTGKQGDVRELIDLEGFGGSPDDEFLPLGECQGDCDSDAHCKGSLVCHQREAGDAVPGCEGGEEAMSATDYCVQPAETRNQGQSGGDSDTEGEDLPELVGLGGNPSVTLEECEGDCDSDSQCAENLVCYQRDPNEDVPGCEGTSSSRTDFCVKSIYALVRSDNGYTPLSANVAVSSNGEGREHHGGGPTDKDPSKGPSYQTLDASVTVTSNNGQSTAAGVELESGSSRCVFTLGSLIAFPFLLSFAFV